MKQTISTMHGWKRVLSIVLPYFIIILIFQGVGALIAGVKLSDLESEQTSLQQLIISFFDLIGTFLLLWLFMKFIDKEPFVKLGFQTDNRLKEFVVGIAIGFVIMVVGYLVLLYSNELFFVKVNFDLKELILTILLFTIVAIVEETLVRGYILKNLMLSYNKYVALMISALLFSLMHSFNPDMDLFSFFDLFLAGIVMGLSYLYTRNLWFPIAMHLSWNLFQSLLGFNVSGLNTYSLIEFKINEPNIFNGGGFGLEGSVLSIIAELLLIAGIGFYYHRKRTQNLVQNELVSSQTSILKNNNPLALDQKVKFTE